MKLFVGCSSVDALSCEVIKNCSALFEQLSNIENLDLILGGASSGLMKIGYQIFKKKKKKILIVLDGTREEELGCYEGSKIEIEPTVFDRTKRLYLESDMALFLDGGSGTFMEVLSFREQNRTCSRDYPIYLYNENHSYDMFLNLLEDGVYRNAISKEEKENYLEVFESKEKVVEKIKKRVH